jgi:hypothetical protein
MQNFPPEAMARSGHDRREPSFVDQPHGRAAPAVSGMPRFSCNSALPFS